MKIELVGNWKQLTRTWSLYGIALLGVLPDLWNLAVSMELFTGTDVPQQFSYMVKVVMFVVGAIRIIKQTGLEKYATPKEETAA